MNTPELFKKLHECTFHYSILESSVVHNVVSEIFTNENLMLDHLRKNKQQLDHFEKLEKDVIKHGIQNPICVMAGFVPPQHQKRWNISDEEMTKNVYCTGHGGSRLWVAKKLNISVPCIIADYQNLFYGLPEYKMEELIQFFVNRPGRITMTRKGLEAPHLPQVHMER